MGQFLAVAGGAAPHDAVERVYARALAAYARVAGLKPSDEHAVGALRLAKFPRRRGATAPIFRFADGGAATSVGAWWWGGTRADASAAAVEAAARAVAAEDPAEALRPLDGTCALLVATPRGAAVVTDRVGALHVYETSCDGCRVVATSALVLGALVGAEFDPAAVHEFVGNGSVYGDRSLFRGVRKLPPGTIVGIDGPAVAETRWFSLASICFDAASGRGGDAALEDAMVKTLDVVLRDPVPPALDLTGGYDSRGVLAAALRTGRTFTTVVNGPDEDLDVVSANRIAAKLGLAHVHQRPGVEIPARTFAAVEDALALTDGEFDALEYAAVAAIHVRTAPRGELSVNGSSGELCRGYWWDEVDDLLARDRYDVRAAAARRFAFDGFGDTILAPAVRGVRTLVDRFAAVIADELDRYGCGPLPDAAKADAVYLLLRMQRWGGRLASATARLRPLTTPFQFLAPMEAALSTPPAARKGGGMAPRVIARLHPRLAALPLAEGHPALPLRWTNAWRFLPKLAFLGGKVARKLSAKLGGAPADPAPSVVADVWDWRETRDLLDPAKMRTAPLYDATALAAFLDASRRSGFVAARPFGRVLTLELAARAVAAKG